MKTTGRVNYKPTVLRLWRTGIHCEAGSGVVRAGGGQMSQSLLYHDCHHLVLFTVNCLFVLSLWAIRHANALLTFAASLSFNFIASRLAWHLWVRGFPLTPQGKCPAIISKLATTVSSFIVPDFTVRVLIAIVRIMLCIVTSCGLVGGYWCFLFLTSCFCCSASGVLSSPYYRSDWPPSGIT